MGEARKSSRRSRRCRVIRESRRSSSASKTTKAVHVSPAPTITSPNRSTTHASSAGCDRSPRARQEPRMRLLLADDNEMNVELATAALDGHDITVTRDGPSALRTALAECFDLVILD